MNLRITVEGFKSISKPHTLDFRPLTLLAGANGSGKSSFMQPVLLLKQTLEAPYDPPHATYPRLIAQQSIRTSF